MEIFGLDLVGLVQPMILLALLCIGSLIKEVPLFDKIANNYIPVILIGFGAIFAIISMGVSFDNIAVGMFMGVLATGLYENIKNVIVKGIINKIFPNVEE